MLNTEKNLRNKLRSLNTELGFIIDDKSVEKMKEAIKVHHKIKVEDFIPEKNEDESDDEWVLRVHRNKGIMDAVRVLQTFKETTIIESVKYIREIKS